MAIVKTRKAEPKKKSVKTAASGTGVRRRPVTAASGTRVRRRSTTAAVLDRDVSAPALRQETIGVRELRDSFSERLRSVRAGKTLTVTDHGEPVAMLIPYGLPAGILRMLSEGTLTWSGSKHYPPPLPPYVPTGGKTLTDIVLEMREEHERELDIAIRSSAEDLRR